MPLARLARRSEMGGLEDCPAGWQRPPSVSGHRRDALRAGESSATWAENRASLCFVAIFQRPQKIRLLFHSPFGETGEPVAGVGAGGASSSCRLAGASKGPTSQEGGRSLRCLPPEVVPVAQPPSPGARGTRLHRLRHGAWGLRLQAPGGRLGSAPSSATASISTPGGTLWEPQPWPHLEPPWGRVPPGGVGHCVACLVTSRAVGEQRGAEPCAVGTPGA